MSDHNTFNSLTAQASGVYSQLPELVSFLLNNRESVRLSIPAQRAAFLMKPLTHTLMGDLVDKIADSRVADTFCLTKAPSGSKIPEVYEYRHVVFDMLQLKYINSGLYDVIARLPEFHNKLLINVSDIYSERSGTITDVSKFHGLVIRSFLARLYYLTGKSNTPWMPMTAILYAAECYSVILGNIVSQALNLSYADQCIVNTIFAYYYLGLNINDTNAIYAQLVRMKDLGDNLSVRRTVDMIQDQFGKDPISFSNMCAALRLTNIPRLQTTIDQRYLYTKIRMIWNEPLVAVGSLDYPPTWVYLLMCAVSSQKCGLTALLKKTRLWKQSDGFFKSIAGIDVSRGLA